VIDAIRAQVLSARRVYRVSSKVFMFQDVNGSQRKFKKETPMKVHLASLTVALIAASPQANAQTRTPFAHALSVSATSSTAHYGGVGASYALRLSNEVQLGVALDALSAREGFVEGYSVRGGTLLRGALHVTLPMWRRGDLSLGLRIASGVRALSAEAPTTRTRESLVLTNDIGPIAAARLSDTWSLRAGWSLVYDLALAPAVDTDAQGGRVWFGAVATVRDDLQLFADVNASGVVGYDGDGAKFLFAATLGLRWIPGGDARSWLLF
jgi:hypothetical protein